MTPSTTAETDNQAKAATSPTAASTATDDADRSRSASRREAVLATALVALVAAVALFGLRVPSTACAGRCDCCPRRHRRAGMAAALRRAATGLSAALEALNLLPRLVVLIPHT